MTLDSTVKKCNRVTLYTKPLEHCAQLVVTHINLHQIKRVVRFLGRSGAVIGILTMTNDLISAPYLIVGDIKYQVNNHDTRSKCSLVIYSFGLFNSEMNPVQN